jgi:Regulator of cell morphogenesis and NO signaling
MRSSFKEIVEEIVATHHSFLRRELPQISELLEALSSKCSGFEAFGEAQQVYTKVRTKIEAHLRDEETSLFPAGIALESGAPVPPCDFDLLERLQEMEKEHDGCGNALSTIAGMIETLPQSDLREQVLDKIKLVQDDLRVHVDKENMQVHPRFLELFSPVK